MKVYVKVKNKKQFECALEAAGIDVIICGLGCVSSLSSNDIIKKIKKQNNNGKEREVFIALPEIIREEKIESFRKITEGIRTGQIYADGIVIESLDALGLLKEEHYSGKVIGGSFLYAYNKEAVGFYKKYFPDMRFIAPDELTLEEIEECEGCNSFILKVYGHQPVMITNQCMNRNYCDCEKPLLEFKDDKNNNFYITSECGQCYDIIYNGPVTYMLDRLHETANRDILLDFTIESTEEVSEILGLLGDAVDKKSCGGKKKEKPLKYTRGHYYKGID